MRNYSFRISVYLAACAGSIIALSTGAFFAIWYPFVRWNNSTGHLTGLANLLMAVIIYAMLIGLFIFALGGFRIGTNRLSDTITAQIVSFFLVDVLEIFISCAISGQYRFWPDFLWRYFLLFLVESAVIGVLTYLMTRFYCRLFPPYDVLEIVGDYTNSLDPKIETRKDLFHVTEKLSWRLDEKELEAAIRRHDAVLLNDLPDEARNTMMKLCYERDKRVYFTPKLSDILVKYSGELYAFDTPLYFRRNIELLLPQRAIKRFFDILLSLTALIVLSPLFLVVMAAIKLEDGGPVFFKQKRATINGREFWILKFRSMIVDAEASGKPHPAENGDKRISKVGKVIRAARIDELPQLINILIGDMSIVGPRPERLEHVRAYTEEIPEFAFRLKVKGGLTGFAQIYGKYNTTPLDKLKLDLIYITNYSLILDLRILFETLRVVFKKESTEGFTSDGKPG